MGINFPLCDQMRMPLYFVLSGIFFKDYGIKTTIVKKVNKLLIPFMTFNLIGAVYFYFETKYLSSQQPTFDFWRLITMRKATGVIWFLLALFWDNMIFMLLHKWLKRSFCIGIAIIALTALGFTLSKGGFNEMHITSSLLSLPFFYLGNLLRRTPILTNLSTKVQRWGSVAAGTACMGAAAVYATYIDSGEIGFECAIPYNAFFFTPYLLGAATVIGIMLICRGIQWLPIMYFMGRYSIIVLCVHIFYVNILVHIRQGLLGDDSLYAALTVAVVLALSIVSIFFMRKYLPWICAQRDVFVLNKDSVKFNKSR